MKHDYIYPAVVVGILQTYLKTLPFKGALLLDIFNLHIRPSTNLMQHLKHVIRVVKVQGRLFSFPSNAFTFIVRVMGDVK